MDITCIISAIFFWVGNLMKLIYLYKDGRGEKRGFNWFQMKKLDPEQIRKEWEFRIENKTHLIATGVITSLAWFFFCFPMLQLVYVLSQKKGPGLSRSVWLHTGIVILTLGGAFTEWISNFLYIGAMLACELMVKDFNLSNWTEDNDGIGWRSLEVTWFALRGMNFWVDAFEWISLCFIMIFVFVSVRRYQWSHPGHFSVWWNALGLTVGLLSLLDFVTEVLRTVNFKVFNQVAFWYGTTNRLILLPAWLILLGWRLPYALLDLEERQAEKMPPQQQSDPLALPDHEMNDLSLVEL
jgi:hypothetical protein